ncbi:MAG: FAD-dependent oxidoreductase [Acidimicrobiia bacterium]|nr:FAD-dependent oxidoreductase [Acidimicrobiia bacterium]
MSAPTVIVGAGIAGLTAAQGVRAAGRDVFVVDKCAVVGGRLATRRLAGRTFDHGAQFFTVRTEAFRDTVDRAIAAGVVHEWCRGFDVNDGHPRYVAHGGMAGFAAWLAGDLDIELSTAVQAISPTGGGWVVTAGGQTVEASSLVVTAPIPETLGLLAAGGCELPRSVGDDLSAVGWFPTIALLVALDGRPTIPEPGGLQPDDGLFGFVADNQQKGISERPAVTLHLAHEVSGYRWPDPDAAIASDLLPHARRWFGDATIVEVAVERWRHAGPVEPWPEPSLAVDVDGSLLVLAGDAFAGPKVEGAFTSGRAAAERVVPG